ncbi:hypothetical protein PGB90_002103 [Kerria lacca]
MSFPTKDQRQKCWGAKDKYWECLESSSEHQEACAELRTVYETLCPAQWVKHFDRKRSYLIFKEQIEKENNERVSTERS